MEISQTKQKSEPKVVEINISVKDKLVVASAMDAANRNLICAKKKTYMYTPHFMSPI